MKKDRRSTQPAGTTKKWSGKVPGGVPTSERSSSQQRVLPVSGFGPHSRLVAQLRRVAAILDADEELNLPQVSANSLERSLKEFVQEVRLGLQEEGFTSTRDTGTRGSYGRRLRTTIKDPELAERVRKNRAAFKEEQFQILSNRRRT